MAIRVVWASSTRPSSAVACLLFLLVGGTGLFLILSYAGVIVLPPPRRCRALFCDPHHWPILCIGIAFFCAGLSLVIPERYRSLGHLNALLVALAFVAGVGGSLAAIK